MPHRVQSGEAFFFIDSLIKNVTVAEDFQNYLIEDGNMLIEEIVGEIASVSAQEIAEVSFNIQEGNEDSGHVVPLELRKLYVIFQRRGFEILRQIEAEKDKNSPVAIRLQKEWAALKPLKDIFMAELRLWLPPIEDKRPIAVTTGWRIVYLPPLPPMDPMEMILLHNAFSFPG